MMTREMMVEAIEALGADATLWEMGEMLEVTFEDFEGFDDEWHEVEREYDNEEAVKNFLKMLEEQCESQEGGFYVTYHFNGFNVQIGYASFDI